MDGLYRDSPATPEQLAAALAALGGYTGTGDAAEHAAEAERLGADPSRMRLANALLGTSPVEALLCEQEVVGSSPIASTREAQVTALKSVSESVQRSRRRVGVTFT